MDAETKPTRVTNDSQFGSKKLGRVEHRPHVFYGDNSAVYMSSFTCLVYAIPFGSEDKMNWDSCPYVLGNFNDIDMKCLIDTGASISSLSRESFQSIPVYQALESVPIPPGFWISAASSHKFSLVRCFMINTRVLGRKFHRPMFVIDGLSKCAGILGIDFIRESQLCISTDHVFYSNLPASDNMACCVLTAIKDLTVPARSVLKIPAKVKSARGKKMLCGTFGISNMAHDRLGVWDSLSKVESEARVFSVFTNALQDGQFFKQGEIIGFFQPIQEEGVLEHGLPEARLDEVFSDFSREPKDPEVGPSGVSLSEEERRFLSENLSVKAPMEFLH